MLDRVQHITAVEQVKIIENIILENATESAALSDFTAHTLVQQKALRYLTIRATEYTIQDSADVAFAFDPRILRSSVHRSRTEIWNTQDSLNRFVEAVQNLGELFSESRIDSYLSEFNSAIVSGAESLGGTLSVNFDGLPVELYEKLCYSLNFNSTVILTKIQGYFAVNPTLTMLIISPIFLVYFKPGVFHEFLGHEFLRQPLYFGKFIKELSQVTMTMRTGFYTLPLLSISNDFLHQHESIHIIGNSFYKHNYLTLKKEGFTSLLAKISKINLSFIQAFKRYDL